ncbi:hypothetical protein C1H46_008091 [Malus baccata]|uniref:Uncharacterized protein n=1 Tax=Malus baccata TaxID=106549 RepID=A0A540N5K6_MALBA|nr:hypothetical protein C1H46_008091 [Malus baccata]
MASSFSYPGFPPVHTHPPSFSAMVAVPKASIREVVDLAFAPFLAKVRCDFALLRYELALNGPLGFMPKRNFHKPIVSN